MELLLFAGEMAGAATKAKSTADLILCATNRSRICLHIPDIIHACYIHNKPFKTKPKTGVPCTAVSSKICIPIIRFRLKPKTLIAARQLVWPFFSLRTADQLAHPRY